MLHLGTGHAAKDRTGRREGVGNSSDILSLVHTDVDLHMSTHNHIYSQPHLQTWVDSWGQDPRVAASSLPRNPSPLFHRPRTGLGVA